MNNNTKRVIAAVTLGAAASLGMLTTTAQAETSDRGCHRSDVSEIAGATRSSDSIVVNLACSGAETMDIGGYAYKDRNLLEEL
ncbi:hypothetical protein [Streptomyces sp. NPDC001903]|uniref:hypothetical protein n=1 Tax=Streptomyces sp. NPDC001903 TaxID=3364622 RepID=UPI0036D03F16